MKIGTSIEGTKKAPYWMLFRNRTMCEELFCVSILICQEADGNNKNNLLNIEKKSARCIKKQNILYTFTWTDMTTVCLYRNTV